MKTDGDRLKLTKTMKISSIPILLLFCIEKTNLGPKILKRNKGKPLKYFASSNLLYKYSFIWNILWNFEYIVYTQILNARSYTFILEFVRPIFGPIVSYKIRYRCLQCKQRKLKNFSNGFLCQIQIDYILKYKIDL